MDSSATYYSAYEEYVLSDNKEEVIERRFSGYEKVLFKILYLQSYCPNSYAQQMKLLDTVKRYDLSGKLRELYDVVKTRMILLQQEPDRDVLPDIAQFVMDEADVSLSVSKPPMIGKRDESSSVLYPSALDYEKIDSFVKKQLENEEISTEYCEKLLETNRDKDLSEYLLKMSGKMGLPGVVENILLYLSTLKEVTDGKLFLELLTFDDMERLQRECLARYKWNLFEVSSFRGRYLQRFGSTVLTDKDDPALVNHVISVYNRRLAFLKANCPSALCGDYEALLILKGELGRFDNDELLEYLKVKGAQSGAKKVKGFNGVLTYDLNLPQWVGEYLEHLFPKASPQSYFPYFDGREVLRIYERAQLLSGAELQPTVLMPGEVEALRRQTRLGILGTNKRRYSVGEEVRVQVELKGIESLEVRLFEVDTYAFYAKNDAEVDVSLDVDGLQPQHAFSFSYKLPAMVSHVETFAFPQIAHRGVYILDFISNGSSSRFLVRMGALFVLSRKCLSGYALTVVDEAGRRVEEGLRAVVESREYALNAEKEILIPFAAPSESAKTVKVLICQEVEPHWEFVTRYPLSLEPETFSLQVTGDVDSEAVVVGNETCALVLRVTALLNGVAFPVSLLRNVSITLSVVSMQGVKSQTVVAPKTLADARDFVYSFRVAETTASVRAEVRAEVALNNGSVKTLEEGCTLFDSAAPRLQEDSLVSSLQRTVHFFRRLDAARREEYVAQLSGRAGEALSGVCVDVEVHHRYTARSYKTTLQSDAKGLVVLGSLENIASVIVDGTVFQPYRNRYDLRTVWQVADTEEVQALIPLVSRDPRNYRLVCTGTQYEYSTLHDNLAFDGAYCVVSGLPAGAYTLYVEDAAHQQYSVSIVVMVGAGEPHIFDSYAVWRKSARTLQEPPLALEYALDAGQLKVRLHGGDATRHVAVLCRTFADGVRMGEQLAKSSQEEFVEWYDNIQPECSIANGRMLWEEYAYIMERKKHPRLMPGNMLPSPGLLLNPVEFSSTDTKTKEAKKGEDFASKDNGRNRAAMSKKRAAGFGAPRSEGGVCSVDDIAAPSVLIPNVALDAEGAAAVPLPPCAYGRELLVVAMDARHCVDLSLYVPEASEAERDEKGAATLLKPQTLTHAFDPAVHYVEEKHISVATKEAPLELASKASMEILHSRRDVWQLLDTLSPIASLSKFSFLLDWESFSVEEKLSRYNRFNCSELNVFVYFRDRAFFDQYVKAYLESKIEKSFLDVFLTGGDVRRFAEPAMMQRLNSFEKALLCSRLGEEGEALCRGMEHDSRYKVMDGEAFAKVFNTALNLKSMKKEAAPEERERSAEASCDDDEEACDEEAEMDEDIPVPPMCYGASMPRMGYGASMPRMDARMAPMMCCAMPPPPVECCAAAPGAGFGASLMSASRASGSLGRRKMRSNRMMDADMAEYKQRSAEKLYEKMEKTKEYREGYYYDEKKMYTAPSRVPLSPFWADFARHLRSGSAAPFMSQHFVYCTHSLSEVIFCVSVLDVAAAAPALRIRDQAERFCLETEQPVFVFHKLLKETREVDAGSSIIILQKYLDNKNSTERVNGKTVDRYMTSNEFLPNEPYGCKIIMTNTSAREKTVTLFYQIPQGAFPLTDYQPVRSKTLLLKPYSTTLFSYSFYFTGVGQFTHYPAHLIDPVDLSVVACAALPFPSLNVVTELHSVDVTSWRDVAATGSVEVVLQFLREHDLNDIDWDCVTFRLTDEAFFRALVAELRGVGYYCDTVWKFGLRFRDFATVRDFVQRHFAERAGLVFASPLLTVTPCEEDLFQIREYKPYVNDRCFRLGKALSINNDKLEAQYEKFLQLLTQKRPCTDDYALLVYYLILQDRIELAKAVFTTRVCAEADGAWVKRPDCSCPVQFDYMAAYFDCFSAELAQARALCRKYADYPVLYWRQLFANVASLVSEMDGAAEIPEEEEPADRTNLPANVIQKKRQQMSGDSSLDVAMKGAELEVTYRNLEKVEINYFELNVELMFSTNPFMKDAMSSSIFIRSNLAETLALPALPENVMFGCHAHALPEALRNKDLLIEVKSGALRETCYFFNSQLQVVLSSKTGQLRVYDKTSRRPLSTCYVKVYAKTSEGKKFLKDGYTDIRGFFDYYAVSSDVCDKATELAIFVEKEGFGSCIRTTNPPTSAVN